MAAQKLSDENVALATEIKTLETALDSHTKANRNKPAELQARRNALMKTNGSDRQERQPGAAGHDAALCERGEQLGSGGACGGVELDGDTTAGSNRMNWWSLTKGNVNYNEPSHADA